jgi:threonine/homoserine/homoserine lactone efflux protein
MNAPSMLQYRNKIPANPSMYLSSIPLATFDNLRTFSSIESGNFLPWISSKSEAANLYTALIVGGMFGLSAGFSPGPLMTLVVTQTLQHNAKEGVLVAAAPIVTDAPIILISFFILNELSTLEPVLGLIASVGGLYVLYLSYETIITGPLRVETSLIQPRSLRKGVLVNALNPHPYLFWATVGVPFILKAHQNSSIAPWVFIFSFYCFLVGSKVFTALIVGRFKTFLEGKIYLYLMRALGVLLFGFAVLLLWEALVHFKLVSH